jgi:16S rRNA (cytosine967-C5)-methyltransferase
MSAKPNPRRIAFDAVLAVHEEEAYANLILPRLLKESGLDTRDKGFVTELVYGALRRQGELDVVLESVAARRLADIDAQTLDVLRLGVYQALFMRVSGHAVVDQSVRLAKSLGAMRSVGFINAVLRSVTGQPAEYWFDIIAKDPTTVQAHPPWIANEIHRALEQCEGENESELHHVLEAHNLAPTVTMALLPGLESFQEGDERTVMSDIGCFVPGGDPALDPRIASGRARVQDEGSQIAAQLLARVTPLRAGEKILDMCAGPGGKTAVLAAYAKEAGATVLAVEKLPHRAELVRGSVRAISQLDDDVVSVMVGDSTGDLPGGTFDRILLDAPCTGLGALRRRPEARWRKTPSDIVDLVPLQIALLKSAVTHCAPGGVIAYVTCSPVVEETVAVIEEVLANHPEVELVDTPAVLERIQRTNAPGARRGTAVQLWTHRHGTDAMFIQLLSKRNSG